MTQILGRIVTPNRPSAPSAPSLGELYYDTTASQLLYWNGSAWVAGGSGGGGGSAEVNVSTAGPSPRVGELLWVDTDATDTPVICQRVTVLPSPAYDGQEVYYAADSANSVLWHLRYNAASASPYKWEFLGGSPLRVSNPGQVGPTAIANVTWAGIGTPPQVTVPLAGDYEVECSAHLAPTAVCSLALGVRIGAVDPALSSTAVYAYAPFASGFVSAQIVQSATLAASTVLVQRYWQNGGAISMYVAGANLRVQPVRVG